MNRTTATTALSVVSALAVLGVAPAGQIQKAPVFRVRTDLMQLDVTVLDKKGEPVRGLTKEDFTLLEDDKPQTIEGFTAVDVPDRVIGGPAWADRVAADVTSNEIENSRIFVLVLDDALGMGWGAEIGTPALTRGMPLGLAPATQKRPMPDPWAIQHMRSTASEFIQSLGPRDLAGVVFTGTTAKRSQNLTADRRRLLDAVAAYPDNDITLWFDKSAAPGRQDATDQCLAAKEVLRMMEAVVQQLASLPDRRKSILYFGGSLPWAIMPNSDTCGTYWMWREVFAAAQQGSVTINPIQTAGLTPNNNQIADRYLSVADYTGGHAVVNTNDFTPGIRRILTENSSYYLLAYQPSKGLEDGTFRRITVKVRGRDDIEIVTKRNYWAPRQRPLDEPEKPPASEAVKAMSGLLPDSKLALRVTATAFAGKGTAAGTIAIALGVKQPPFANRTPESVELMIRSFTTTGDPRAGDDQTIPITVPAARADQDVSRYEVLARIDVAKPGPYHLRLSAHSDASDTRGSVYVDVEVPNFKDAKLSLSGVVVNALGTGAPVAPARVLNDLTAVVPTTERSFAPSDLVTAFLRVYQGGNGKVGPVTMKVRIADAADKSVFSQSDTIEVPQFDEQRSAPYQFRLPIKTLAVGRYLLTLEAVAGKTVVTRDVVFDVR